MSVYDDSCPPPEPPVPSAGKPLVVPSPAQPPEIAIPLPGQTDNLQARLFMSMEGFAPGRGPTTVDSLPLNAPGCLSVKCAGMISTGYQLEQQYGFEFAQKTYLDAIALADSQQTRIQQDRAQALQQVDALDQHIRNSCQPDSSGCGELVYKRDEMMTDCELLQLDSMMSSTTRINYALACIRSGNEQYMSAGQDTLNQLLRSNPQLMTPDLQDCIKNAYTRGASGGFGPNGPQFDPGPSIYDQVPPGGTYPQTYPMDSQAPTGMIYERSSYAPTLDRIITPDGYSLPVSRTYHQVRATGDVPPIPTYGAEYYTPTDTFGTPSVPALPPDTLVADVRQPVVAPVAPVVPPVQDVQPVPPVIVAQAPPVVTPDRVPVRRDNKYPFPVPGVLDGVYGPGVKPEPGVIPDKVPVKPNTVPGPVDVPVVQPVPPRAETLPIAPPETLTAPSDRYKLTPQEIAQRQAAWLKFCVDKYRNNESTELWAEIKKPPDKTDPGKDPNDGLPNNPFQPKKNYTPEIMTALMALAGVGVAYKILGRSGESPYRVLSNNAKVELRDDIIEPQWRIKDKKGNFLDEKTFDGKSFELRDVTGKVLGRVPLNQCEAVLLIPKSDADPKLTEARMRAELDMHLSGRDNYAGLLKNTEIVADPALKGKESKLVLKDPSGKEMEIRSTAPDGKLLVKDGDKIVERAIGPDDKIVLKVSPTELEKAKAEHRDIKAIQEIVTGKLPGRDALARLAAWEADLKAREEKLARNEGDLKTKTEDANKREADLKQRDADLKVKEEAVVAREETLKQKAEQLATEEGKLGEERKTLDADKGKLAKDQVALGEKEAELARDKAEGKIKQDILDAQEKKLVAEREQLDLRDKDVKTRDTDLTGRESKLAQDKAQFEQDKVKEAKEVAKERLALEQERQKLATDQSDLAEQRRSLNTDREQLLRDQKQQLADREALAADKKRLKDAQAQLDADQKRVADLEKAVNDAKAKVDTKETDLKGREDALTKESGELAKDKETLAKDQKALADDKVILEADRQLKQSELDKQQKALDERTTTLKQGQDALAIERAQLEIEKRGVTQSKADVDQQKQALERDQAQLKVDKKDLEKQKTDLDTREKELAKEKADLEAERERVKTELAEANERVKAAELKADAAVEQARAAERRATALADRVAELETARANFLEQRAKLERALADLKATSASREAEMTTQLADLNKVADERAKALETATKELQKALGDRKALAEQVALLEKNALRTADQTTELERLRGELAKSDTELEKRGKDLEKVKGELDQTKADLAGKEAEVKRVNDDLIAAKKEADQKRELAEAEKRAREAAEKLAKEATERAEALNKRVGELEKAVADTTQEKTRLQQALDSLTKESAEKAGTMKAEIDRLTKLADTKSGELGRATTELKDTLADRKALAEKVAKLEADAATNAALKPDLDQARADLAKRDRELETKSKEVATLETELAEARRTITEQEKLVAQARQEAADAGGKPKPPTPPTQPPAEKKFKLGEGGKEYTTGTTIELGGAQYKLAGGHEGKFVLFKEGVTGATPNNKTIEMTLVINGKETPCVVEANASGNRPQRVFVKNGDKFEHIGEIVVKSPTARTTKGEGGMKTYGELVDAASPKDTRTGGGTGTDASVKPGDTTLPKQVVAEPARTEAMTDLVKVLQNQGIQEKLGRSLVEGMKGLQANEGAGKVLTDKVRELLASEAGVLESELPKFRIEIGGDDLKAPEMRTESGETVIRIPQKMLAENPSGAIGQICGDIAQVSMKDGLKGGELNSGERAAATLIAEKASTVAKTHMKDGTQTATNDKAPSGREGPAPDLTRPEATACALKDGRVMIGKVSVPIHVAAEGGLKMYEEELAKLKRELKEAESATTKDDKKIADLKEQVAAAETNASEMGRLLRDLSLPEGDPKRTAAEEKMAKNTEFLKDGAELGRETAKGGKGGGRTLLGGLGRGGAAVLLLMAAATWVAYNYGALHQKHQYNPSFGGDPGS